ncbi:WXG100 family type VII secretion target [Streptomyces noursei]|uniref:WXG100 family type VII secretion target n=1 Tax=Streptomyces noursei TaxID=1971 RepID=UPI0019646D03|nr:type VII secretion target [Streptomyces noursei]QRX95836.1 ESX-1 secretion-associated protein [Streptomyces noursei]
MTHEHFTVHPDKLRALSKGFAHTADRLDEQVARFADKAENVDDAFGVLSESTEALAQYVEMTKATVHSLQQLCRQLAGYASGLDRSAAGYESTDAQHTAMFKGA